MIKLLAIPVAGTIAALVAILLAHPEREGARPAFELPPIDYRSDESHGAPDEQPERPEAAPAQPIRPPPAPAPIEFHLRLEANGVFVDVERGEVYGSVEELAEGLGDAPHTLVIANGEGVGEEALDQALARLRDRFLVRKVYRAPESQPEEEEPGPEETDK